MFPIMKPDSATNQAKTLSSGTLANLTGVKRYDQLDVIQNEFVAFCVENEGEFTCWQTAWEAFKLSKQLAGVK